MYDEEDRKKTIELIKEIVLDELERGVLEYPLKLLRKKIYMKLKLSDLVQLYYETWKLYILILGIVFFIAGRMGIIHVSRNVWIFINIAIIAAFIIVKLMLRLRMKSGKKKGKCSDAYEQDPLTKQWFLKEADKKKCSFWFGGMISWFIIYVGIAICFDKVNGVQYIYPALFIVFFYENWLQYEWLTKEEFYKSEIKENPKWMNKKTLFMMQHELTDIMPSESLLGYEADREEQHVMTEAELDGFLAGDSHAKRILKAFCGKRREIREKDIKLLESALELLDGHSVLFTTSFYKDADYAFLLPAYLKLIRGETVLVVCSIKVSLEEVLNWIREEFMKMNGMDWWGYNSYQPFHKPGNVVAVYCSDFDKFYKDIEYDDFRHRVGLLFLLEPSEYTADCREKIRSLCNERKEEGEICLAVTSGKTDTLELLNWGFEETNVFIGQLWRPAKKMQVLYWREEIEENRIGEQNWGNEEKLLRYLVNEVPSERIVWIGGGTLPVWDILWNYKRFCNIDVGNLFSSEEYGFDLELNDETYMIVEDFLWNYKKTAKLFCARGTDKSQVHVIVPNYLLREYIGRRPNEILLLEGISRQEIVSERNTARNIFFHLTEGWVPVEKIREQLAELSGNIQSWEQYLGELLRDYVGGRKSIDIESQFMEEECCHIYVDERIKGILKKDTKLTFYLEGENHETEISTDLTYNTLFQKYLPGQYMVLKNKSYQFWGLIEKQEQFIVRLKRNLHAVRRKSYYRQIREYEMSKAVMITPELLYKDRSSGIKWEYGEADIRVRTYAYYEMKQFADFGQAIEYLCNNIPDRKYIRKRFIKVTVKENSRACLREIATWLSEAFYSLCPDEKDYLAVCLDNCKDSRSIYNVTFLDGDQNKWEKAIYIFEDRERDSGILQDMYEKQDIIMNTMNDFMTTMEKNILEHFL